MSYSTGVLLTGGALAAGWAMHRAILYLLIYHGITTENYRKEHIPRGSGLFLWIVLIFAYGIFEVVSRLNDMGLHIGIESPSGFGQFTVAAGLVFFAGWFDDTAGDPNAKGFRGHIRTLLVGRTVTSGMLKAGAAFVAAAWLALLHTTNGLLYGLLSAIVICLAANFVNLLDLRPGRAAKGFLLIAIPLALLGLPGTGQTAIFTMLAGALILLPDDLKGKAMLGDSGANLLGFTCGYAIAVYGSWILLCSGAILLLLLHVVAERSSFTIWIERFAILRWIDRLGRL